MPYGCAKNGGAEVLVAQAAETRRAPGSDAVGVRCIGKIHPLSEVNIRHGALIDGA